MLTLWPNGRIDLRIVCNRLNDGSRLNSIVLYKLVACYYEKYYILNVHTCACASHMNELLRQPTEFKQLKVLTNDIQRVWVRDVHTEVDHLLY